MRTILNTGRTRIAEWSGGEIDDWRVRTADHGLDATKDDLATDEVTSMSAELTTAVVSADRDDV